PRPMDGSEKSVLRRWCQSAPAWSSRRARRAKRTNMVRARQCASTAENGRYEDRVEADILRQARELQQLARPELFGRRLVSELKQRLLLFKLLPARLRENAAFQRSSRRLYCP